MNDIELAELDRQVAEAIGGKVEKWFWIFQDPNFMPTVSNQWSHDRRHKEDLHDVWMPSVSWDHAMYAAENYYAVDSLCVQRDKNLEWDAYIGGETAHAQTGPLAICQAILALKGAAE